MKNFLLIFALSLSPALAQFGWDDEPASDSVLDQFNTALQAPVIVPIRPVEPVIEPVSTDGDSTFSRSPISGLRSQAAAVFDVDPLVEQCDLEPGELVWSAGDAHIYLNHAHLVEATLAREPRSEPRLRITRRPTSIFDYAIEDFEVEGYDPHPHIAAPVAV